MLLTTAAWLKACFYLGCISGWAAGARPQFDLSTNMGLVLVPADAEVDSVIFRLRATDQDADFPLIFDITAAVQPIVRVTNLPCTLYNKVCQANVILTRRLVPGRLHDFAVRVRDSKGDSNSMQATISVTNATTPRDMIFPHIPSIIMVPEDTKPGKELDYLLVRANPWHGKPVYIELWQPKELFTIRQRQTPTETRGVIILDGELDFETQSMYTLTMYATDPYTEPGKDTRNIAGVHVVVIVQDVQDVPPVFTLAPPLTRVNNSVKPGDVILRVHAEDGDKGTPREVTYGLVSEGNPFTPFFNISEWTGEIILARPLEELTQITHVGAPILLTVVAEEVRRSRDEPPGQATVVELGLLLGEPGNSPPYFESDSYVAWMDENAAPGTVVTFENPDLAKVRDEDIGKTGVFALILGNNNGSFEISPNVAEKMAEFVVTVRDNALMDYETRKTLQFTIIAQEVGPATNLSTSVPVTVFLRDVNDNPPKFEKDKYEVTIAENVPPGTRVVQVHATDNDTGLSGSVKYTAIIGPGSETLTMDSETGLITVVAKGTTGLDREVTASLELMVEARDENGRGLRSTVPLIVNLLDVNDNAPVFDKLIYEFILNSDQTNFTYPAFIRAVDADAEPPNNEVRYELMHGNYGNKFYLNEVTGEIILREPLNKSRRRRNNPYVTFATKFRSDFLQTLDTFKKIGVSTDKPLKMWKNRKKRNTEDVLYTLTVRAYDLGVPHRSSTASVRIVTATPMGALTLMLVVPAENLDPIQTTDTLAAITGGRVTIQEIRPYDPPSQSGDGTAHGGKMSLVVARVEPRMSGTFLVDVETIQKSLAANGMNVIPVVNSTPSSSNGVTAEVGAGGPVAGKGESTTGTTSRSRVTENGDVGRVTVGPNGGSGTNGNPIDKSHPDGSGTGKGGEGPLNVTPNGGEGREVVSENAGNGKPEGPNGGGKPGTGTDNENPAGTSGGTSGGKDGSSGSGTGGQSTGEKGGGVVIGGNDGSSGGTGGGVTNRPTGVIVEETITKVNKTTLSTTDKEDDILYKAENKLLMWLLILLGLLMLLGLLALILCCICPRCPFYMAPRKRRVHSFEIINHPDSRPKRHLRRKQVNPVKAAVWPGKKQAWSADAMRRNWQFNRRNTKNRGLASLPGDVAFVETAREQQHQGPFLRVHDGPESWSLRYPVRKREDERIYIEDVEAGRTYDTEDMDSLRRHEMERGSDVPRHSYRHGDEMTRFPREQLFYRDGNAEVLRLVTGGHLAGEHVSPQAQQRPTTLVSEQQALGYRIDGKDIILRRFIEDQKMRQLQDIHSSVPEICVDNVEPGHQRNDEFLQNHEVIILPRNLELDNRYHREESEPGVQRLIIDHGDIVENVEELEAKSDRFVDARDAELGQKRKVTAAAMLVGSVVQRAANEAAPMTNVGRSKMKPSASSINVSTYAIHDVELAKQNALLTQLLMDRASGLDPGGSYLETQSLPGQVAIATQTDRTAATQTDNYVHTRSRSDNDESEEEIRSRKKSKSKKRFGNEIRRTKTIWMKSPIQEETRSVSATQSTLLRRKAKEARAEGRRATLEPEVLREISDSLDEQATSTPSFEGRAKQAQGDVDDEEDGGQSENPALSSPDTSKDKYHRRSHAKAEVSEALQKFENSKKHSSPSKTKKTQQTDTKSADTKKMSRSNSEKKESASTDGKSQSKQRYAELENNSGGTAESEDKKMIQAKSASKPAGILETSLSTSDKPVKKSKSRETEERVVIAKKRTMLKHQKAKKVSTESSEFEEIPVKPRRSSLRAKQSRQALLTSGSNSKGKGGQEMSTLTNESKSRSLGSDRDRLPKAGQRKPTDSSSSTGTTEQEMVRSEKLTTKKSGSGETKKLGKYGKKMVEIPVTQPSLSTTHAEHALPKVSSSTAMSQKSKSDSSGIKSPDAHQVMSDEIPGKREERVSESKSNVLTSLTPLLGEQVTAPTTTASGTKTDAESMDKPEHVSMIVDSKSVKSIDTADSSGKVLAETVGKHLVEIGEKILDKPSKSDTGSLISKESTPEAQKPLNSDASKLKASDSDASKSEELDFEVSKPEESVFKAAKPKALDFEAEKPKLTDSEASKPKASNFEASNPNESGSEALKPKASDFEAAKPKESDPEATKPKEQIFPFENTVESGTSKVFKISENVSNNLRAMLPVSKSNVSAIDEKVSLVQKGSELSTNEGVEVNKEIRDDPTKVDVDLSKSTTEIIPAEKHSESSSTDIIAASEKIQPAEIPKPEDIKQPKGIPQPEEIVKPEKILKSNEILKPEEIRQPEEIPKPEEIIKPEEILKLDEISEPKEISPKLDPKVAEAASKSAVSEERQTDINNTEVTRAFLQNEAEHSSHDPRTAHAEVKIDSLLNVTVKSSVPDSTDVRPKETLDHDTPDGENLVADKNGKVKGSRTEVPASDTVRSGTRSSCTKEVESPIKSKQSDSFLIIGQPEKIHDAIISTQWAKPERDKRPEIDKVGSKTESKSELQSDEKVVKDEQKSTEIGSGVASRDSVETSRPRSADKSHLSQSKSIERGHDESAVQTVKDRKRETKADEHQFPKRDSVEGDTAVGKSPEKKSANISEEDNSPGTDSPSFYILSSESSAEGFIPDQGGSQINSGASLSQQSRATRETHISKFPTLNETRQPEKGKFKDDSVPNTFGTTLSEAEQWDRRQLDTGDLSIDPPDPNSQPYQTPRHRSRARKDDEAGSVGVPEIKSQLFQGEHDVPRVHLTSSPDMNPTLKEPEPKITERQLTPKLIAEEAIRSGLEEIIKADALQREHTSQKTVPDYNRNQQRVETVKRKPAKESSSRTLSTTTDTKKSAPEKTGAGGSQSKIEESQETSRLAVGAKTAPKGDAREESTTRRPRAGEKTRQGKLNVDELKPENSVQPKADQGAIPKEGYMSRYKQKREEMERRRKELKEAAEEEQRPRWQRKPVVIPPQRLRETENLKKDKLSESKTPEGATPRARRRVKPLANAESEQLRAMVKEGRKQRKAEGGDSDDPTVEIFATEPPARMEMSFQHPAVPQSSYKYDTIPPPFYLHPPPPPHSTPQISPLRVGPHHDVRRPDDDLDSGIAVSLQGGTKLRHQQLLDKKSVFDIAYSEAAPSQLRTDSTTPPS